MLRRLPRQSVQPQFIARIASSYRASATFSFVPGATLDAVGSRAVNLTGLGSYTATGYGIALQCADNGDYVHNGAVITGGPLAVDSALELTLVAYVKWSSSTGGVVAGNVVGWDNGSKQGLGIDSSGFPRFVSGGVPLTGGVALGSDPKVVIFRFKAGSFYQFIVGNSVGTETADPGIYGYNGNIQYIGGFPGQAPMGGQVYMVAAFNRVLPAPQCLEIAQNPWQIFSARRPMFYTPSTAPAFLPAWASSANSAHSSGAHSA